MGSKLHDVYCSRLYEIVRYTMALVLCIKYVGQGGAGQQGGMGRSWVGQNGAGRGGMERVICTWICRRGLRVVTLRIRCNKVGVGSTSLFVDAQSLILSQDDAAFSPVVCVCVPLNIWLICE